MIAVVPVMRGAAVSSVCLRSWSKQTVDLDIVFESGAKTCPREIGINRNRHALQSAKGVGEFVLLLDSDVVMDDPNMAAEMIAFLRESELDCVAVRTKSERFDLHIFAALALIRTDKWREVDYAKDDSLCQCAKIARACKIGWHPTLVAREIK